MNSTLRLKSSTALARSTRGFVIVASTLLAFSHAAFAAGTLAGTDITNVAKATYDGPTGPVNVQSNPVVIKVDELLNVVVTKASAGDVPTTPGAADAALKFTITNTGNGSEAFRMVADAARTGDDFDTTSPRIFIDNGNGIYDPGTDVLYVPGSNDPVLAADGSVTIFVLSNVPGTATDGQFANVALSATAVTGSGAPGTTFAGQGTGGSNAVVGASTASREDIGKLRIAAATAAVTKSATVADPFGGTRSVPGSIITYSLVATVSGTGSLANMAVSDVIPTGTLYQAGSLTLQSAGLTDVTDADAGRYDGTGVSVALGTVAAGQSRTVTFRVVIQ